MPEILLLPQVSLMLSTTHRNAIQKRSFSVIIAIYTQLYENMLNEESAITNEEGKEDSPSDAQLLNSEKEIRALLFTKTPKQVAELLKVD